MAVSLRIRFEVFKRDAFTCRYCGRTTPSVVLEVDHIVPVAGGGSDDPTNLATSCWECNRGKSDKQLSEQITGEDPHDKAVTLLELQRQLREYDAVVGALLEERIAIAESLRDYWLHQSGEQYLRAPHFQWLVSVLEKVPSTTVKEAMMVAIANYKTADLRYVMAVIKNKRRDTGDAV